VPAAAGEHRSQSQARTRHGAEQVDLDDLARNRVALVDESAQRHDPGVVDQHVHGPELGLDRGQERLEGGGVGDVQRQREHVGIRGRGGLEGKVADRDVRARSVECLRSGTTDSAGPARDHGDATRHAIGGRSPTSNR
jgi:hypothetical protein